MTLRARVEKLYLDNFNIQCNFPPKASAAKKKLIETAAQKYTNAKKITVMFLNTGTVTNTTSARLYDGCIKDRSSISVSGVGYIGFGKYISTHISYEKWSAMLNRCYGKLYQKEKPTYRGCTVCEEWHNFQNFALWYEENYPNDGIEYQLDKDIKIKGNKVYSPDSCAFVTRKDNMSESLAKNYVFLSPGGVEFKVNNLADFCRENELNSSAMSAVHNGKRNKHKGWRKHVEK